MTDTPPHDRLDTATSARLARLAGRPVDTTNLQRQLEQAMHAASPADDAPIPLAARRWRRAAMVAAVALVAALAWGVFNTGSSPAMAGPAALAQIHYDVINGLSPHMTATSVDEVNRLLADQASGAVPLPPLPGTMKSCCLHLHAGAQLSCALIEVDGKLVTVAVADGAKLHSPDGQEIVRDGRAFIAHTANGINMVMAQRDDRWLCVMGEVDFEPLADLAARIRL